MCKRQRVFLSANMASMGFGLPVALSAKIDFPDKQVVCVTGDRGFCVRVIEPQDLNRALRSALDSDKPSIVDVVIDPLKYEALVSSAH